MEVLVNKTPILVGEVESEFLLVYGRFTGFYTKTKKREKKVGASYTSASHPTYSLSSSTNRKLCAERVHVHAHVHDTTLQTV